MINGEVPFDRGDIISVFGKMRWYPQKDRIEGMVNLIGIADWGSTEIYGNGKIEHIIGGRRFEGYPIKTETRDNNYRIRLDYRAVILGFHKEGINGDKEITYYLEPIAIIKEKSCEKVDSTESDIPLILKKHIRSEFLYKIKPAKGIKDGTAGNYRYYCYIYQAEYLPFFWELLSILSAYPALKEKYDFKNGITPNLLRPFGEFKPLGGADTTNAVIKVVSGGRKYTLKFYRKGCRSINREKVIIEKLRLAGVDYVPAIFGGGYFTIDEIGETPRFYIILYEYIENGGDVGGIYWNELIGIPKKKITEPGSIFVEPICIEEIYPKWKTFFPGTHKIGTAAAIKLKKIHTLLRKEFPNEKESGLTPPRFEISLKGWLNSLLTDIWNKIKVITKREDKNKNPLQKYKGFTELRIYYSDVFGRYIAPTLLDFPTRGPIHGDMHLGQILAPPNGNGTDRYPCFIDFEGHPNDPIERMFGWGNIFEDIAGIIRSLSYIKFGVLLTVVNKNRGSNFDLIKFISELYGSETNRFVREVIENSEIGANYGGPKSIGDLRNIGSEIPPDKEIVGIYKGLTSWEILCKIDFTAAYLGWNIPKFYEKEKLFGLILPILGGFSLLRAGEEFGYELMFRPQNVPIPLAGLVELTDYITRYLEERDIFKINLF